ncbi:MAG: FAD-dependent oxidoreductase [Caulobacteraceae bacterium]
MAKPPAVPAELTCDVIVVGGGMAGATLALALRSGGLRPIVIERAPMSDQWEETFDGAGQRHRLLRLPPVAHAGSRRGARTPRPAHRADPGHRRPLSGGPRRPGPLRPSPCASIPPRSPTGWRASRSATCWRTAVSASPWPGR